MQLVDRLKDLHELGYIHCDLKPDNILLSTGNRSHKESSQLVLIDFGISKSWKDMFGDHVKENNICPFSGNLLFASKNAFLQK